MEVERSTSSARRRSRPLSYGSLDLSVLLDPETESVGCAAPRKYKPGRQQDVRRARTGAGSHSNQTLRSRSSLADYTRTSAHESSEISWRTSPLCTPSFREDRHRSQTVACSMLASHPI